MKDIYTTQLHDGVTYRRTCMSLERVVNQLIDFPKVQYAGIEALKTETDPERFVIAYRNQQSLHDVDSRTLRYRVRLLLSRRGRDKY